MVLETLFREVGQLFIRMCNVTIELGEHSFTVGTLYVWCGVAAILIYILRGLAD